MTDLQDSQWAQFENEERRRREDELMVRLRKDTETFRMDNDKFHEEFQRFTQNMRLQK